MSFFKKIPNPFGKKGGEEHQEKIKEVAKEVDARDLFPDFEKRINLSDGSRRFIDLAGLDDARNIVELHQIGKQTKKGLPVKRERVVIEEVSKQTGIDVEFHPYNETNEQ